MTRQINRASLAKDLKELSRSPWSGHSALTGKVNRLWQDAAYVLSYFGKHICKSHPTYFINTHELRADLRADLVSWSCLINWTPMPRLTTLS